jgi:hypothetical protein
MITANKVSKTTILMPISPTRAGNYEQSDDMEVHISTQGCDQLDRICGFTIC